jgi:hypothetical protein
MCAYLMAALQAHAHWPVQNLQIISPLTTTDSTNADVVIVDAGLDHVPFPLRLQKSTLVVVLECTYSADC